MHVAGIYIQIQEVNREGDAKLMGEKNSPGQNEEKASGLHCGCGDYPSYSSWWWWLNPTRYGVSSLADELDFLRCLLQQRLLFTMDS